MALPFGRGHGGKRAEGFPRGSVMTIRESSQLGGLGLMSEIDIAHGPSAFVFLSRVARNFRHHNRPVDIKTRGVQFSNPRVVRLSRNKPRAINSNTIFPATVIRLWNWVISKRAVNAPISPVVSSCTSMVSVGKVAPSNSSSVPERAP